MTSKTDELTVLLSEANRRLARLYTGWLTDRHSVITVHSGEDAIESFDDNVDIVILNRFFEGHSGAAVCRNIRQHSVECPIIMLTTHPPDFDIIDVSFDKYLVKPVDAFGLHEAIAELCHLPSSDELVIEYHRLVTKKQLLESTKSAGELSKNETFQGLLDRIDRVANQCNSYCGWENNPDTVRNGGGA